MSSSLFQTTAFTAATIYIRNLFKSEDHIFNLIDHFQNDPTLFLDVQLILEAVANEKRLEELTGYTKPTTSNYVIVATAIAAAIRHGILDAMRDSGKFPLAPDYIYMCFAG